MKVYINAYKKYFKVKKIRECSPKSLLICEVLIETTNTDESYANGWWLVNRDNIFNK